MRSLVLSKVDCFLAHVCSALMLSSMVRNVCKLREHKERTALDLYFPLIVLQQFFFSESRYPGDGNFCLDHYTIFKMGQPTFGDDSEAATGAKSSNQVAYRSNLICIFISLCWLPKCLWSLLKQYVAQHWDVSETISPGSNLSILLEHLKKACWKSPFLVRCVGYSYKPMYLSRKMNLQSPLLLSRLNGQLQTESGLKIYWQPMQQLQDRFYSNLLGLSY